MNSTAPVSVVIPAFNSAASLGRAVESVVLQTTPPAEVIIVDDASTDGTWDEIRRLAGLYAGAGIVGLRLDENLGPGDARNRGWEAATQELIAFLDADDAWHLRKLEVQHQWMLANPTAVLSGHYATVVATGRETNAEPCEYSVTWLDLGRLLRGNPFSTPTVMVRRAITERFKRGKRYSEDYLLWLSIVGRHGPAACIELPLTYLFKARYGAGGLSGRLWDMEKGEIDTLRECWRSALISTPVFAGLTVYSLAKFLRRTLRARS
jgi:glycosyltransferase involved in cell wall biosynthesis